MVSNLALRPIENCNQSGRRLPNEIPVVDGNLNISHLFWMAKWSVRAKYLNQCWPQITWKWPLNQNWLEWFVLLSSSRICMSSNARHARQCGDMGMDFTSDAKPIESKWTEANIRDRNNSRSKSSISVRLLLYEKYIHTLSTIEKRRRVNCEPC